MRLVVFRPSSISQTSTAGYHIGALIDDDTVADLTPAVLANGIAPADLLRCYDLETDFVTPAAIAVESGKLPTFDLGDVDLASPVPRPGKIICIGLNYRNHAIESGMEIPKSPIIFSKFQTSVVGSEEPILLPAVSTQVDFEAELAVVIGRRAKNVKAGDAMNYVFGYTNFNDVSARDFQFADGQWQRGKSCDTFAPMGPYIATADEIADPHALRIQFRLNGETMQDSTTAELIFRIPELIEFLSASITLEPGDVIATGTPPGVGFARKPPVFMTDGDVAEVEIEGLGVLINPVNAS
jgi:2-keto-4-pentenoate hydratase/2-oxohepta-3-ene-1,7-dioic acid hydratase in catechol pathway